MSEQSGDKPERLSDLKPDNEGFRYVRMWMDWLIEHREDADGSYLLEWREFIDECQKHIKNLAPVPAPAVTGSSGATLDGERGAAPRIQSATPDVQPKE